MDFGGECGFLVMTDFVFSKSDTRLKNFIDRAGLRGFPWKTAIILYVISWGWLFFVQDSYWADDWNSFLYPEITPFDYHSLGLAPWTELNQGVFELFGPGIFRLVTFCFYFGSGVAVFGISKAIKYLNLTQRQQILVLFLLLPFESSRVTLMVFHYTTAYFAFFLAWYLIINFPTKLSRIFCLFLFFFSFQMHSLVFFILLPFFHLALNAGVKNISQIFLFCKQNLDLMFLPFLYVILRLLFWNQRFNYQSVTYDGISQMLKVSALAILFTTLFLVFSKKSKSSTKWIFVSGVVASVIALTPYVLGGFYLSSTSLLETFFKWFLGRSDWNSRHQVLQPLGAALLIVSILNTKLGHKSEKVFFSLVLSTSVVFNVCFGFEYVVDFAKQRAISNEISIADNSNYIFELQIIDNTINLNARGREYRKRDWLGIVSRGAGIEKALEIDNFSDCRILDGARLILVLGPETHWEALKNWISDGDMGFEVTIDDRPGACKPEMVTSEYVSGAIPILFYFTGAKD